jgi:hypothetical protein
MYTQKVTYAHTTNRTDRPGDRTDRRGVCQRDKENRQGKTLRVLHTDSTLSWVYPRMPTAYTTCSHNSHDATWPSPYCITRFTSCSPYKPVLTNLLACVSAAISVIGIQIELLKDTTFWAVFPSIMLTSFFFFNDKCVFAHSTFYPLTQLHTLGTLARTHLNQHTGAVVIPRGHYQAPLPNTFTTKSRSQTPPSHLIRSTCLSSIFPTSENTRKPQNWSHERQNWEGEGLDQKKQ